MKRATGWARRSLTRSLLIVAVAAFAALGAWAYLRHGGDSLKASSAAGERILLVSSSDISDPVLSRSVADFTAAGFTVFSDSQQALQAAGSQNVVAFFVTRGAFPSVPGAVWRALYQRNVIVGGLNVSLEELQPLALPGTVVGSSRVRYSAQRPIFSFLYSLGGCGRGAMSDWLDNWPHLSGVVQQRALEIATAPTRGLPDMDCPADKPSGGSN